MSPDVWEIERLKYPYRRFLDTKDIVAKTHLMVEDVTVA